MLINKFNSRININSMENQQQVQNESIEDYQITVSEDVDYLKIIEILKKNNFDENFL